MRTIGALWRALPLHGRIGLGLVLFGEALILVHDRPVSDFYFPVVWAGFVLVLDAALLLARGRSLLLHHRALFCALFPISSVFWWVFELFNQAVHNWLYIGAERYTGLAFLGLGTLDFSFVLPAVVLSALVIGSLLPHSSGIRPAIVPTRVLLASLAAGVACIMLPIFFPTYFFGLVWGSLFFVLDPLNYLAGRPSLLQSVAARDWRTPLAFALGALTCGFFWEAWNYWAMPKWVYTIPYVNHWHIFEMPLLGWLGYLPFGLELFAMANFVLPLLHQKPITLALPDPISPTISQSSPQAAR